MAYAQKGPAYPSRFAEKVARRMAEIEAAKQRAREQRPFLSERGRAETAPDLRGSDNCIVTVCIGAAACGLESVTLPAMRAYAETCNADFRVITDLGEGNKYQHPKYAVMQIADLYREHGYKRILYMDADIMVRPTAPNAFDAFPTGKLWARNEMVNWQTREWESDFRERMNRETGVTVEHDGVHFNGGFQLTDREHADLYQMPPWCVTDSDRLWLSTRIVKNQPWFNHRRQVLGIPFGDVGFRWNALFGEDNRNGNGAIDASFMWHFGTQKGQKFQRACGLLSGHRVDTRRVSLVTVTVGDDARDVAEITGQPMRDYAHRCGYDFHEFTETGEHVTPLWTRFDALAMLGKYDLIIYLDNDVIVKPTAPPLTWFLPARDDWDFAAFNSCELDYMPRRVERELPQYCKVTGAPMPDGWTAQRYPNSGVMVFNNTERMRTWKPLETAVGWADQNALIHAVMSGALAWRHIPRCWNFGHMHIAGNLEAAMADSVHFAHFTGTTYRGGRKRIMATWTENYERTQREITH
jgi:lipopolysaccharide biosynthesis glycosyltransferase